jgi:hypothetical protein
VPSSEPLQAIKVTTWGASGQPDHINYQPTEPVRQGRTASALSWPVERSATRQEEVLQEKRQDSPNP